MTCYSGPAPPLHNVPLARPQVPPELHAAREALQRWALQRLRELQLLADWPLQRPARTRQQMLDMLQHGELLRARRCAARRQQVPCPPGRTAGDAGRGRGSKRDVLCRAGTG
jgi:hypothetical protein